MKEGGREGEREGWREGGWRREGGGMEGGREGGREGEWRREGGRENYCKVTLSWAKIIYYHRVGRLYK